MKADASELGIETKITKLKERLIVMMKLLHEMIEEK
jgi:hypothetical protein